MNRRLRLGICVLVLGAQACGGGVGDAGQAAVSGDGEQLTPTFQVDPSWPMIPNNWVFGITSGVSIDAENNIWVLHRPRTIAPELADRLRRLDGVLDADRMRELNAAVDLEGQSPSQVARDWLKNAPIQARIPAGRRPLQNPQQAGDGPPIGATGDSSSRR